MTIKLNECNRTAFERLVKDFEIRDPTNALWYQRGLPDFDAYVKRLSDDESGIGLAEGIVPCTHRWLMDQQGDIVGVVRVRHNLDAPYLASEAGHIGYDVPPSHRGQGYGVASLRAGLNVANELGLTKILVCADSANERSWRTIERCGGILEQELLSEIYGTMFRRYWIEI